MAKRTYGAGSKTERGEGTWRLRAYDSGTRRQVSETFHGTEKMANKALAELVAKVGTGQVDTESVTVGEVLTRWLEHIRPTRRPSTIHSYELKIERYLRPEFGSIKVAKLGPHRIDTSYRQWQDGGLSESTVHQLHSILSAALNQAVKWGWIRASPTKRTSPPPQRQIHMETPTLEQLSALYAAAQGDPVLACAIALATVTGARRGELCALRWSDIDLTAKVVVVQRSLTVIDAEYHEGPTKTHQERRIALDPVALKVLKDRWAFQRQLAHDAESPLADDPYVLSSRADASEPLSPNTLTKGFIALKTGFRFHDLRHFAATQMIGAGVDVRTVAGRLGHADASTTLRVYAHALPERDRKAAGILGRALKS